MITSSDVYTHHNRQCRLRLAQYHMEMSISNISRDKSFVDDLNKEQGIVSMRVGSALRSTEIKPLFPDLWRTDTLCVCVRQLKSPLWCGLYRVVCFGVFCSSTLGGLTYCYAGRVCSLVLEHESVIIRYAGCCQLSPSRHLPRRLWSSLSFATFVVQAVVIAPP